MSITHQVYPVSTCTYVKKLAGSCCDVVAFNPHATPWGGNQKLTRTQLETLTSFGNCAPEGKIVLHGSVFCVEADLSDYEAYVGWRKKMQLFSPEHFQHMCDKVGEMNPFAVQRTTSCYRMRTYVNISLLIFVRDNVIGANQERVDPNAPATRPIVTRMMKLLRDKGIVTVHDNDELAHFKYGLLVIYVAGLFALNKLQMLRSEGEGSLCYIEDVDDDAKDKDKEDPDVPDITVPLRDPYVGERPLRESVVVQEKNTETLEDSLECGRIKPEEIPDADLSLPKTINIKIGPHIVTCNASIHTRTPASEKSSMYRHYAEETKPKRTARAKTNFTTAIGMMERCISRELKKLDGVEATLPTKWSEATREHALENASEDRVHRNEAFVKSGEIGLGADKRAREIVTQGQDDAGANATGFVSVFEKGVTQAFPNFFTKGLTTGQTDAKMHRFLLAAVARSSWTQKEYNGTNTARGATVMSKPVHPESEGRTHKNMSVDFCAMDSSWSYEEKEAIVNLVKQCSIILLDQTDLSTVVTHDPRLDAPVSEHGPTLGQKTVYLEMRRHIVSMSADDATLFSGERGTSIYNRMLVLAICTAEIIRVKGEEHAELMWRPQKSLGTSELYRTSAIDGVPEELQIGDGDDLGQCTDLYKDAKEMIAAFAEYGKTITCVCDPTCTMIELLSRFHMVTKAKKFYSLTKVAKNFQRCVMTTTNQPHDVGVVANLTGREYAEIATSLFYKALASAQTPGMRWYAFQVARLRKEAANAKNCNETVYDRDLTYKRQLNDDQLHLQNETLDSLEDRVRTALDEADCSMAAMVKWATFGAPHVPVGENFKRAMSEWQAFDDAAREREVTNDDVANPEQLVEDLCMSDWIAKYVGVPPELVTCARAGHLPRTPGQGRSGQTEGGIKGVGATAKVFAGNGGSSTKAEGLPPRGSPPHHESASASSSSCRGARKVARLRFPERTGQQVGVASYPAR